MKKSGMCVKCGSPDVFAGVRIEEAGGEGHYGDTWLVVHKKPNAVFFKGTQKTELRAWVCGDCGFCELYAHDPSKLKLG